MKQKKLLWIIISVTLILLFVGTLCLILTRKHCAENILPTMHNLPMPSREDRKVTLKRPEHGISIIGSGAIASNENDSTSSLSGSSSSGVHKTIGWIDGYGSLQDKEMANRLYKAFELKEQAEKELEDIQRSVKDGKIRIEQNRGLSTSVIKTDKALTVVVYDSPTGPVRSYSKNIYKDSSYQEEINSLGCELHFYTNGVPKEFFRRDMRDALYFGTEGQLIRFTAERQEVPRYYLVTWDDDGKLLHEGYPRGIIGEIKDGKYIKYPSHPDYNGAVSNNSSGGK